MKTLLPNGWVRPKGYANGVSTGQQVPGGRFVFVAGMIGWDAQGVFQSDDFLGQTRQALQNIVEVLQVDGAQPEHIVRMTWYITNKREYLSVGADLGKAFRAIVGNFNIAMTAVEVSALMEDRAKVEIEATAFVPE